MKNFNKQKLIDACISLTEARLAEIRIAKEQSEEAIREDTKSSAGDKYETTREMVQQDLNRYQTQLQEAQKDLNVLQSLSLKTLPRVGLGSVVHTDFINYFIATSIGQVTIDAKQVYVISPSSPVGLQLLGKNLGDSIIFNGKTQQIITLI